MSKLDIALHDLYFAIEVEDGGINWNESPTKVFSWYYAENRLYLIRENSTGGLYLIKAHNPIDAMMKVSIKINEL